MRYYSYSLQKDRSDGAVLEYIRKEGYIGVYAPASGLDGSRFEGGGIDPAAWRAVFAQALEIRLALLFIDVLNDINQVDDSWSDDNLEQFELRFRELVHDLDPTVASSNLSRIREDLNGILRKIDIAVNNAPLTRALNVHVHFNPGSLVFGLSKIAQQTLAGLENVTITYMLDELENLTEEQQKFVNTLVREKQLPTSFVIGSREWGIRTHFTLSAGEENREGSEFRKIVPEEAYGNSPEAYRRFCIEMIEKRLRQGGLSDEDATTWVRKLDDGATTSLHETQLRALVGDGERKYIARLRDSIRRVISDDSFVRDAINAVTFEEYPLLEKLAILRAYQGWSRDQIPAIRHFTEAREFIAPLASGEAISTRQKNFLNLWKHDMIAQLYADYSIDQPYSGIDNLIAMSGHLPRSLLVTLKYITTRSEWRSEDPFTGSGKILTTTQSAGMREASAWYLNDVRPLGAAGANCDRAIRRLGSLLRDVRYSDKPSEVNITSFSSNLEGVSDSSLTVLQDCVKHRMLIEVPGGRQARNRGTVHHKYQIHPMLAPFFALGFGRRGDLTLSGAEFSSLFSPDADEREFQKLARRRLELLQAPFGRTNEEYLF
nr:hypothetical protein [Tsukamurella tyrosinosolvens]